MAKRSQTILVADDELIIRVYVSRILTREGFQLLEAADGMDALQLLDERGARVDLLLTDVRMPRMDGVALARSVTEMYPGTPVMFISGFPFNIEQEQTCNPLRGYTFLAKPFDRKSLVSAVRKCLSAPKTRAVGGG